LLLMAGVLTGCQAEQKKMLGITGYNYTNRYIDGFSVNGQGGGNVLISEDHAGGVVPPVASFFERIRSCP